MDIKHKNDKVCSLMIDTYINIYPSLITGDDFFKNETALLVATAKNLKTTVSKILSVVTNPTYLEKYDCDYNTALTNACQLKYEEIAIELITKMIRTDNRNRDDQTEYSY